MNIFPSQKKKKKKKKTMLASLWLCLADPTLCHALLVDRNKHVLLSLPRCSGFMPERIQDVLLALAFLACGGHHILLRLLSLHLCNEYLSLPKKKKKKKRNKHVFLARRLALV